MKNLGTHLTALRMAQRRLALAVIKVAAAQAEVRVIAKQVKEAKNGPVD